MKKAIVTRAAVITMLAAVLAIPAGVSAFWPFDNGSGSVMGAQTGGGFFGLIQGFFGRLTGQQQGGAASTFGTQQNNYLSPNNAPPPEWGGPSGATGAMGMRGLEVAKARITQAVQNGSITQAQGTEIINHLTEIETKQQELMQLQQSFRAWLQANNIPTTLLGAGGQGNAQGGFGPAGATGGSMMPIYRVPPQGGQQGGYGAPQQQGSSYGTQPPTTNGGYNYPMGQ